MSFRMISSDPEWLSKIFNDRKSCAVSLRQLSLLCLNPLIFVHELLFLERGRNNIIYWMNWYFCVKFLIFYWVLSFSVVSQWLSFCILAVIFTDCWCTFSPLPLRIAARLPRTKSVSVWPVCMINISSEVNMQEINSAALCGSVNIAAALSFAMCNVQ